jgi:hypothetical protein
MYHGYFNFGHPRGGHILYFAVPASSMQTAISRESQEQLAADQSRAIKLYYEAYLYVAHTTRSYIRRGKAS